MNKDFKAQVDLVLQEFQAGLQTAPRIKKAGQQAKSGLQLMDSDLEDEEVMRAAATGDKMALIKALKAKRLRDKQDLENQMNQLDTIQ